MATSHYVFLPADVPPGKAPKSHGLIYFIPGNPGLIDYYEPFFQVLRSLFDSRQSDAPIDIYGQSLAGFHDDDHEPFTNENLPYGLQDQIDIAYDGVSSRRVESSGERNGNPYDFVIVMGHSVGSYITLEIFHRHLKDPSPAPHLNLHHGILLFPTVTYIAHSPSGQKLNLLRTIPFLDAYGHHLARAAAAPFPESFLRWLVGAVLGMPDPAAAVTARFLKSPDAIWQALHMGKDEMAQISEDKWDEELWEIPHEAEAHRIRVPKFMFLFGKHDHWVADHLRDEFIGVRRTHAEREGPEHKRGRTEIEVDEEGRLPHAFCTREASTVIVAEKVKAWIGQIQDSKLGMEDAGRDSTDTFEYEMKM